MEKSNNLEYQKIIEAIKTQVKERKQLFARMKEIYNPENDRKDSNIFCFLEKVPTLTNLSETYLKEYEAKLKVQLPEILKKVLVEIGSGKLNNTSFLDQNNELRKPIVCMEDEFLEACLALKISPQYIEDELSWDYDFEENKFKNPSLQRVYESLNANRDKLMTILFYVGQDSYIILIYYSKSK